ncbi:hypothetical protein WAI453_009772 [Rhynchosporium graminicola]
MSQKSSRGVCLPFEYHQSNISNPPSVNELSLLTETSGYGKKPYQELCLRRAEAAKIKGDHTSSRQQKNFQSKAPSARTRS